MKVLLKLPLSPYSGYGNDGIGIARAFVERGADVYLQPTSIQAPLPRDIALLLTKELQAPFDLSINHVDPGALEASPEAKRSSDVLVGWTMWEYSNLHNLDRLKDDGPEKFREELKNFDMILGYDDITVDSFREFYDGPMAIQQGGFWPEDWPEVERDWHEENFYFCMIGVLSERKDPFKSIQAFIELKAEDAEFDKFARLSLKTTHPGLSSRMEDAYPGLRIFYDMWPTETVKKFYEAQHVLLAPSRGEGKNMPALEFMSTGGTVIATNWAGHKQWLNDEYSYPLNFRLDAVDPEHPDTLNARADIEHLKRLMLHVFRNREEAQEKGRAAAQAVPKNHSWHAVIDGLFEKVRELPQGERLWQMNQEARNAFR